MAVGLAYLRATLGCLLAAVLLIPYLDRIYNRLTASENGREVKCSVSSGTVGPRCLRAQASGSGARSA